LCESDTTLTQKITKEKKNMLFKNIIRKKKKGLVLSQEEINFWIQGVTKQTIPDYQTTALLMAIFFQGMNVEERSFLTTAMAQSGDQMDFSNVEEYIVDKHSTGGVGDKTSLFLAPLMAAASYKVPMISGRGLGFTGGTLDKLESIPNYNINLTMQEMKQALLNEGCFIAGQTGDIAPADKKIYSLRDVIETVDEISLITASILSKKFTEDLDGLLMDVKCGTGAFMKNFEEAENLATSIVGTTKQAGKDCKALITRMDYPLGEWVGNSCEVYECLEMFKPSSSYYKIFKEKIYIRQNETGLNKIALKEKINSVKDNLVLVSIALAIYMFVLNGKKTEEEAYALIDDLWQSGALEEKFFQLSKLHGGDVALFVKNFESVKQAFLDENHSNIFIFKSPVNGKIKSVNGERIGNIMVELGAGRKQAKDEVNHDVSLQMLVYMNQELKEGDAILKIYHPDKSKLNKKELKEKFHNSFHFTTDISFDDDEPLLIKLI